MIKFMGWIFVPLLLRTSSCDYMVNISVNCDFEYGLCGWRNSNDNRNSYWKRKNHNGNYFLYLNKKSTATLESSNIHMDDFQCLTFWYDMSNEDVGTIQVSLEENGTRNELNHFKKSNDKGNSWTQAIVEIEGIRKRNVKILLRGQSGSYFGIRLDNISLTSGSCLDCHSEQQEDFCNWDGHSIWNRTRKGLYSTRISGTLPRNQSILTSKSLVFPGQKCLSFMYTTSKICTSCMQVLPDNGVVLSNISDILEREYIQTFISICLFNMSRIAISFVHGRDDNGTFGIGNIFLKEGLCSETTQGFKERMSGCTYVTNTTENTTTDTAATTTNIIRTDVTGNSSTSVTIVIPSAVTMIDRTLNDTVQETTNARSTSTSVTTTITPETTHEAYSTDTLTITVDTSINISSAAVANSRTTAPVVTSTFAMPNNSTNVAVSTLIPIVIGCVVMVVAVLFVAVCFFRIIRDSVASKTSANDVRISSERTTRVSSNRNSAPNVRLSLARRNQVLETANDNARVQEVHPGQSEIPFRSVAEKASVSSLANHLKHTNLRNIKHPLQTKTQTCENVGRDGNSRNDTQKPVHDDTYNSTITCGYRSFDVTYDHTHFKGYTDNTYDHIHFTPENAYDTTI